jgi:hypothetical protein
MNQTTWNKAEQSIASIAAMQSRVFDSQLFVKAQEDKTYGITSITPVPCATDPRFQGMDCACALVSNNQQ